MTKTSEEKRKLLCALCGTVLTRVREKRLGLCESCIDSLPTDSAGETW